MRKKMNKKEELLIEQPIDIISFFIFLLALMMLMIIKIRYAGSTEFPTVSSDAQNLLIMGFFAIGIYLFVKMQFFPSSQFLKNKFDINRVQEYLFAVISYILIQIIVFFLSQIRLFQVSVFDVYAFYISAGVIEEFTYRLALIGIVQLIIFKAGQHNKISLRAFTPILIILSGLIFALVHRRYYSEPLVVLLTFLGGCSQAHWYIHSKNIMPPLIAHVVINFLASGSLIQTL